MQQERASRLQIVARPPVVLILGVTQRSGTHYLYDLLNQHPECRPAVSRRSWEGSWEDNLLRYADHLEAYARAIGDSNRLNPSGSERRLLAALGHGLIEHLTSLDDEVAADDRRTVVTKTPTMKNLQLLPLLLPEASAVLLIRDPRAVLASALRTFGRTVDEWALAWRTGAREALAYERAHPGKATVVRYEDLYSAPESVLSCLLDRLGLDPASYDFSCVSQLPVRGSSQLGGEPGRITWDPRPRGSDFDPLGRGGELAPAAAARLRWLAESEMRAFGYWQSGDVRPGGLAAGRHLLGDVRRRTGTLGRRAAAAVRRAGPATG